MHVQQRCILHSTKEEGDEESGQPSSELLVVLLSVKCLLCMSQRLLCFQKNQQNSQGSIVLHKVANSPYLSTSEEDDGVVLTQ